jgi:hypothetical protein
MSSKAVRRQAGGEEDLSIDEIPDSTIVLSSELPDEIIGTVQRAEFTTDRYGRQIIKFRVLLDNGRETVLTFPPSMFGAFKAHAKKLNISKLSEFVGRTFKFKRMNAGKFNARPRHFPIEELTVSSEEVTKRQRQPTEKPASKPSAKPARKQQEQQEENEEEGEEEVVEEEDYG